MVGQDEGHTVHADGARFIPQGGVLRERLEMALVCEAGGYSPDEKTFELPSPLLRAAMHSGLIGP